MLKIGLLFGGLLCVQAVVAKTPKLFSCQQADGSVVIQDRRCQVTAIQQPKPVKPRPQKALKPDPKASQRARPKTLSQSVVGHARQSLSVGNRSPYFNFGWERFIPANWQLHKIITNQHDLLLLSRSQFNGSNDFEQGVKLSVYSETMKKSRLNAFAQALQLYHQIRDNQNHELLDSQFKSHPSYKVFNIKYLNSQQQLLLTEFYIDEKNNDLFVVTIQSYQANWQMNSQLAEQIISQL